MSKTPINQSGKNRLQLDLTDRQFDSIKKVKEHIDCNSYSEVFRRALVVMEKIVEIEQQGVLQFGFIDKDNQFSQVWFL